MHDLTLEKSILIGIWVETLLYGAHVILFFTCIHILLRKTKHWSDVNKPLLGSTLLLFSLATLHVAIGLRTLIEGFIWTEGTLNGVFLYFIDQRKMTNLIEKSSYVITSLIGDAVLIWRCYVLWAPNYWICALPCLFLVGSTVSSIVIIINFTRLNPTDTLFVVQLQEWVTSLWALSLATQTLSTGLIVGKIWRISRGVKTPGVNDRRYMPVIWTVVESGALYCVTTGILLVLYELNLNCGAILDHIAGQVAAMVPILIIVRVGLGLTHVPFQRNTNPDSRGSTGTRRLFNRGDQAKLHSECLSEETYGSIEDHSKKETIDIRPGGWHDGSRV